MVKIPTKVQGRLKRNFSRFKKILKRALDRDVNEADTVDIINDIFAEIFGYDKYLEITREYVVKNTYCDLAIKIDESIKFLIEIKAIGIELKENHVKQAVDYGANHGTDWVILTNGIEWRVYQIKFEKPIKAKLICDFNFFELNLHKTEDLEMIYILCKEGLNKNAIDEFNEYKQIVNKFFVSAIIQGEEVQKQIRKELRKLSPGIKVDLDEINTIVLNSVLKREVIEDEEAESSVKKYRKLLNTLKRKKDKES